MLNILGITIMLSLGIAALATYFWGTMNRTDRTMAVILGVMAFWTALNAFGQVVVESTVAAITRQGMCTTAPPAAPAPAPVPAPAPTPTHSTLGAK
jgi:hypothetical protein